MHIEQLRYHCLKKKGVEETFPFGEDTLVFKVLGKMFCLTSISEPNACNVKCDPERAIELRQQYEAVEPGYHMDKKHWNTITYNIDLNDKDILSFVDHSYELVVNAMPLKLRKQLV